MRRFRGMLVVAGLALAALSGCASYNPDGLFVQTTPTSEVSKQHWDVAMAGIVNQNEGTARFGLKQLANDARSTPQSNADREYWISRLQKVSLAMDQNNWTLAQEELQSLRWRYGRM